MKKHCSKNSSVSPGKVSISSGFRSSGTERGCPTRSSRDCQMSAPNSTVADVVEHAAAETAALRVNARPGKDQVSELLILPDGRILVHNLTQTFAGLLHELNPNAEQITSRVLHHSLPLRKPDRADLMVRPAARQRRPAKSKAQFRNHSNIP